MPSRQFLPYTLVVVIPTTNEPVVELSGAFDIRRPGQQCEFQCRRPHRSLVKQRGTMAWMGVPTGDRATGIGLTSALFATMGNLALTLNPPDRKRPPSGWM